MSGTVGAEDEVASTAADEQHEHEAGPSTEAKNEVGFDKSKQLGSSGRDRRQRTTRLLESIGNNEVSCNLYLSFCNVEPESRRETNAAINWLRGDVIEVSTPEASGTGLASWKSVIDAQLTAPGATGSPRQLNLNFVTSALRIFAVSSCKRARTCQQG